ncbi:MAG: dihydrodipicolinate synthase family protein [Candidatus Margulisiibacteriota bacterium]
MSVTMKMPLRALRQISSLYIRENVVPTVTPFLGRAPNLGVDRKGVARLCDNLARLRVKTLFVAGTTGEFVHMTDTLRLSTIDAFAGASKGRFRIIANATGDTPEDTFRNLSSIWGMTGVNAVVLAPLHYLKTNREIFPHMEEVGKLMEGSRKPLFLYNYSKLHINPSLNISPQVVGRLTDEGIIVGIKDSSGDLRLTGRYAMQVETGTGDEGNIVEAIKRGASFAVGSMGNILPYPQNIFFAKDVEEMWLWQKAINDVRMPLTANLRCPAAAIKYYLHLQGICSDVMADKNDALTGPEKAAIEAEYKRIGQKT